MPQAVLDAPSVSSSGLVGWEWCFEAQSLLQGTGACRFRKVPHHTSPSLHRTSSSHLPIAPSHLPVLSELGQRRDIPFSLPRPNSSIFPGGTLVWHDNTAVNYSNWGQHDTGPSMLSQNSCYWIQSSNGVWRLGSCTNVTMGVICKIPRGRGPPAAARGTWG